MEDFLLGCPITVEYPKKLGFTNYLHHFSETLDLACAERTQNQGF